MRYIGFIFVLICISCVHNGNSEQTTPNGTEGNSSSEVLTIPSQITDSNYRAAIRAFRSVSVDAQGRAELRRLIVAYLRGEYDHALSRNDSGRAWELFSNAVDLYQPEELQPGVFDENVRAMALGIIDVYEPQGDEARVLGSLLVLTLSTGSTDTFAARYDEVVRWSEDVRRSLPSNTERVLGLVDVFERVTGLIALPDPVNRLGSLYIERHNLLQNAFGGGSPMGLQALLSPRNRLELQSLYAARGETVPDLITLYLRAGRVDEVRRAVSPLGHLAGVDRDLLQAVRDLRSERRRPRGMKTLARILLREHPDVSLGLCHDGYRSFPEDAAFSQCLAEIYRHLGDHEGAMDFYEDTLRVDPSVENFERTLEYVALRMEEHLSEENTSRARETHARAQRILESFTEQHPNREPPIREDRLAYLIGVGEYNAGNIDQAFERLRVSIDIRPSRSALVQIGMIEERRNNAEQAIRYYRQALDLDESTDEISSYFPRALILQHLADAYDLSGNSSRAQDLYNEALIMLEQTERIAPPHIVPDILLERGFIQFKLDDREQALRTLRLALENAPQRRSTYARLLSFYVGHGLISPAVDVFRIAFNHSELDRMWKIYYSMWIIGLQQRLNQQPDEVATRFLQSVEGDEWIDRLGRFYAGNLPYQELLGAAETQGQRAEAYYYEAILQIAQGNQAQGLALLEQVIETNMMGYFEYEFARLLRTELARSVPQNQTANSSP